MNEQHTPEPWSVKGRGLSGDVVVTSADGSAVGVVINGSTDEADARRIVACVNACAGMSQQYLEELDGETLGNKVAELEAALASEQQDYQDAEAILHAERDNSQALRDKVAEQAAVIEKLRTALCVMLGDSEADPWLSAEDKRRVAYEALAIPTDSKQVLNDWMREQKDVQDDNK